MNGNLYMLVLYVGHKLIFICLDKLGVPYNKLPLYLLGFVVSILGWSLYNIFPFYGWIIFSKKTIIMGFNL